MLLLIKDGCLVDKGNAYLNTSNVTVNRRKQIYLMRCRYNLNTSNVTVNHKIFIKTFNKPIFKYI